MKDRKDKKIKYAIVSAIAVATGMILGGCNVIDGWQLLDQKCNAGDTENVDGTDIAVISFLLTAGQDVVIEKRVISSGNGNFKIYSSSDTDNEILDGGRVVMVHKNNSFASEQKILVIGSNEDGKTRITASMNCKDRSVLSPIGRNNKGLSSDKNSTKPAPTSYPGFGH